MSFPWLTAAKLFLELVLKLLPYIFHAEKNGGNSSEKQALAAREFVTKENPTWPDIQSACSIAGIDPFTILEASIDAAVKKLNDTHGKNWYSKFKT